MKLCDLITVQLGKFVWWNGKARNLSHERYVHGRANKTFIFRKYFSTKWRKMQKNILIVNFQGFALMNPSDIQQKNIEFFILQHGMFQHTTTLKSKKRTSRAFLTIHFSFFCNYSSIGITILTKLSHSLCANGKPLSTNTSLFINLYDYMKMAFQSAETCYRI